MTRVSKAQEKMMEHTVTRMLTPEEVAERLRIKTRTLKDWRVQKKGPTPMRFGTLIRYRQEDLENWIQQHMESAGQH